MKTNFCKRRKNFEISCRPSLTRYRVSVCVLKSLFSLLGFLDAVIWVFCLLVWLFVRCVLCLSALCFEGFVFIVWVFVHCALCSCGVIHFEYNDYPQVSAIIRRM